MKFSVLFKLLTQASHIDLRVLSSMKSHCSRVPSSDHYDTSACSKRTKNLKLPLVKVYHSKTRSVDLRLRIWCSKRPGRFQPTGNGAAAWTLARKTHIVVRLGHITRQALGPWQCLDWSREDRNMMWASWSRFPDTVIVWAGRYYQHQMALSNKDSQQYYKVWLLLPESPIVQHFLNHSTKHWITFSTSKLWPFPPDC